MLTKMYTAQKGLILDKSKTKILVNKYLESKYLSKILVGKFCLPGGQIEFGENPDEAFVREIKEETGITIVPLLPFYVFTWIYKKENTSKQIVAVARLGVEKSGMIKNSHGENETKLEKARWIDIKKLDLENFVEDERPVIKKFLEYKQKNPFRLS